MRVSGAGEFERTLQMIDISITLSPTSPDQHQPSKIKEIAPGGMLSIRREKCSSRSDCIILYCAAFVCFPSTLGKMLKPFRCWLAPNWEKSEMEKKSSSRARERDGIGIIDGLPSQPSTNDLLMVVG